MNIEKIAKLCHEINRIFCEFLGDNSQAPWDQAPDWQKQSCIAGVKAFCQNPLKTPEQSHQDWMDYKLKEGWTFGPKKDPVIKTHPCILPYSELPEEQKLKDLFFLTICRGIFEENNE